MKIEQYRCDVCGIMKKETNHWFLFLEKDKEMLQIMSWDEYRLRVSLELGHLCGRACAQKKLEEWMTHV